jgi:ribosome-associated protein
VSGGAGCKGARFSHLGRLYAGESTAGSVRSTQGRQEAAAFYTMPYEFATKGLHIALILVESQTSHSGRSTTLVQESTVEAGTLARRVVELAEDKQASEIVMLDLRKLNTIADYFVICSGESDRQLKAILEAIDEGVSRDFARDARVEGTADTGWVLLDYGDVVVHIFSVALRDYYRLEQLWSKALPVVVVQ